MNTMRKAGAYSLAAVIAVAVAAVAGKPVQTAVADNLRLYKAAGRVLSRAERPGGADIHEFYAVKHFAAVAADVGRGLPPPSWRYGKALARIREDLKGSDLDRRLTAAQALIRLGDEEAERDIPAACAEVVELALSGGASGAGGAPALHIGRAIEILSGYPGSEGLLRKVMKAPELGSGGAWRIERPPELPPSPRAGERRMEALTKADVAAALALRGDCGFAGLLDEKLRGDNRVSRTLLAGAGVCGDCSLAGRLRELEGAAEPPYLRGEAGVAAAALEKRCTAPSRVP